MKLVDVLIGQGKVVKPNGDRKWVGQCPAHDDGNPSLSIAEGRGQTLLFCFAGCTVDQIVDAVGWTVNDLFDDPKGVTYEYRNRGRVTRRVHRSPQKAFRQEVIETGDGALYVYPGIDLEKAVRAGQQILVPEGEKDVDALFMLGNAIAVTSAGGAQAWGKADWSILENARRVTVIADPDVPGMERANALVKHLRGLVKGAVDAVKAKAGKDAADHLTAGLTVDDFVAIEIDDRDPEFEAAVQAELDYRAVREEALRRERAAKAAIVSEKLAPKPLGDILDTQWTEQWVIPNRLEAGDRLVLTGVEGGGKSYFMRQLAIMASAGLDPFTMAPIDPAKVLVIDTENSERQWSRAAKYVTWLAGTRGSADPRTQVQVAAGARIDLGVTADVNQVNRLLDEHDPKILVIGPLYKLVSRGITNDDDAAPLIETLDSFRERGIVLLMEAHAGHAGKQSADLRPRGSSALLGWPEFGWGLLPDKDNPEFVDVVRWRGDREERDWPKALRRGFEGELPWEPAGLGGRGD